MKDTDFLAPLRVRLPSVHLDRFLRWGRWDQCVVVVGLDDRETGDDFLRFDIRTVGHKSILYELAGSLKAVAAGQNRRAELLYSGVPLPRQDLHFLGGRLGGAFRRIAKDE